MALSCCYGYSDFSDASKITDYWGGIAMDDDQPPPSPPPSNQHLLPYDLSSFATAAEEEDAAALRELEEYFSAAYPPTPLCDGGATGSSSSSGSLHHLFGDGPVASPLIQQPFSSPDIPSSQNSYPFDNYSQQGSVPGAAVPNVHHSVDAVADDPMDCLPAPKRARTMFDDHFFHKLQQSIPGLEPIAPSPTPAATSGWFVDTPAAVTQGFSTVLPTTRCTTVPSNLTLPSFFFPLTQPPPLPLHALPPLPLPIGTTVTAGNAEAAGSASSADNTAAAADAVGASGSGASKTGISAQSAAARNRRKKISDKTRELGRLIPGGNKMNTAEMFQAAYSYVKFLQAQIGVLQVAKLQDGQAWSSNRETTSTAKQNTNSSSSAVKTEKKPEDEAEEDAERELQRLQSLLLTSPAVQERLSRAEKCIVPVQLLEDLAADNVIRSHPSVSRDLGRLLMEQRQIAAAAAAAGDTKDGDNGKLEQQNQEPPKPLDKDNC